MQVLRLPCVSLRRGRSVKSASGGLHIICNRKLLHRHAGTTRSPAIKTPAFLCKKLSTPAAADDPSVSGAIVSNRTPRAHYCTNAVGFVDTHCHLDLILPRLSRQSQKDARKARAAGQDAPRILNADFHEWRSSLQGLESSFEGCVTVGCGAKSLDAVAEFLAYDGVHGAFGIHPLNAAEWCNVVEEKLVDMMTWDKVVALGECGLDYYDKSSGGQIQDGKKRALQRQVFAKQLKLATALGMPLVVHTRHAEEDTLELMTQHLPALHPVHVHCFTSSLSMAQALLEYFPRLYIGFTGVITFKNAPEIREVVRQVPLQRMLLETDGPYMAPEPFRGRIAHPGHVVHVARAVAKLKGVNMQEVLRVCRQNAQNVYGF